MRLFVFLICSTCQLLISQNLVPNCSFEEISQCPNFVAQIHYADQWSSPTLGSPDLFAECSTSPLVSVPDNPFGSQMPFDGSIYSGVATYHHRKLPFDTVLREYIQIPLLESLSGNIFYKLSFYVSLAETSNIATKIGFALTEDSIFDSTTYALNSLISYESNLIIRDDTGWTKVEFCFHAQGNERYLLLGNFKENPDTVHLGFSPSLGFNVEAAYYFIDKVELMEIGSLDIIADTAACQLSLSVATENQIVWSNGDTNTKIQPSSEGLYTVQTTQEFCVLKDSLYVNETKCQEYLVLPNIFTPNQDGFNDVYKPLNMYDEKAVISIYNRWGKELYKGDLQVGWDGKTQHGFAESGIYYYTLDISHETVGPRKGFFSLIR